MNTFRQLWSRLANSLTQGRQEADRRDEMKSHIDMQTDDNLCAGMSPAEARRQARLKFGDVELAKIPRRPEIGISVAVLCAEVLTDLLFGIAPTDVLTYVCVAALLTLVSLAACYVPARRATRVDPMTALRYE